MKLFDFYMKYLNIIKFNRFICGLYYLFSDYFRKSNSRFGYIAADTRIIPPVKIQGEQNIFLYENTNIYAYSMISATNARFIMKKNSGAAEGLMVRTGNHMSLVGRWFKDITDDDKGSEYDKDVIVEEDVWIAANVTLLSGVIIGRGAIVGAGSVVRKSIPPYAIVAGNPCKIVGFRFTPKEVIEHEKALYPEDERLTIELLEKNYDKYFIQRMKEIREFNRL